MEMRQVLKCFYKAGKAVERLEENEWEGVSWKQDKLEVEASAHTSLLWGIKERALPLGFSGHRTQPRENKL